MPLLLCRRADFRFALDSTGLIRVLSADEIATHCQSALLNDSLLPCDPALLLSDSLTDGTPALPPPPAAGLLYRHGDLEILVSVDRVDRPSPKDHWENFSLPRSLRAATTDLISDVACRRTNGQIDLVPRLDLAALWDETPHRAEAHASRPLSVSSRRTTVAGLLHWPLTPGCPIHLAVSLSHVCELATDQQRLILPGLPPSLAGLCLWRNRLLPFLDPAPVFLEADSLSIGENDLPATPPPDSIPQRPASTYTLIIATERPDEPLALAIHTLPQRLRRTADCRPVPLTAEHPDPILYGRFDTPRGPLLLPAWHRTLTHALLAAHERATL